jgi:endonuclease-3
MPRKSPRSRRRNEPKAQLPKRRRSRGTPRVARAKARRAASPGARHAPKGARAKARARTARPASAQRRLPASGPGRGRWKPPEPERVAAILGLLAQMYPDATTALRHENALQLLIATILSAQCTDERVNLVTPALFARYPDARALAEADRGELEEMIRSTGFYRNKAKSIQACCAEIVARHAGEVPRTLEALTELHGVGRKTANVVLGNAFDVPGLVVDTHVGRVSRRLALTREVDPVKVEFALMEVVPRERWSIFSHWLILHGRRICIARKPRCSTCPLLPHCPRIGVVVSQ